MTKKKILLIEDDADDQLIFMDALHEVNGDTDCLTAYNGQEALVRLQHVEAEPPSLIFLDLNMPLMNGFEFLDLLRKESRFSHIPVVIFTTSDNPLDQKRAKESGARIFFTKTPDFKLFKSRLSDILKSGL